MFLNLDLRKNIVILSKDIVCASASSIILSSINLAIDFNSEVKYTDDLNKIEIINNTNDENVQKVFSNMILSLEELEKQYPDNIKISKGDK